MFLEALPLTKDLKVDRGRLPVPPGGRPELLNEYVAPTSAPEQQMARIWSEVLEIEPVGVTDSLFALGGDSLRAMRIVNRLRPIYGDRIHVTSLFGHVTIRELVRALHHKAMSLAQRPGLPQPVAERDASAGDHRVSDDGSAVTGMA
jgi:aryl carrier-like protein